LLEPQPVLPTVWQKTRCCSDLGIGSQAAAARAALAAQETFLDCGTAQRPQRLAKNPTAGPLLLAVAPRAAPHGTGLPLRNVQNCGTRGVATTGIAGLRNARIYLHICKYIRIYAAYMHTICKYICTYANILHRNARELARRNLRDAICVTQLVHGNWSLFFAAQAQAPGQDTGRSSAPASCSRLHQSG
jgi:hypothetical protein